MTVRFWSAITVLTAMVLTFAMPGTAEAAGTRITISSATGDDDGVIVRGRVASTKACIKNRLVKVYHDVPPPGPSDADFLLGTVRTNAKGTWRVSTTYFPDKVYAVVTRKPRCRTDRSPTEEVDFDD